MILYYCSNCWVSIATEYGDEPPEVTIVDKTSRKCDKCKDPAPHYHTLRTKCKRGHTLDAVHTSKGVKGRYCTICARMAEQRHRDRNPGYHSRFKKKVKDAT